MSNRPSEMAMIEKVMALMPHTPAARPSMPSMKLTMFMMATTQSMLNGMPTQPRLRMPSARQRERLEAHPVVGHEPRRRANCPASLTQGRHAPEVVDEADAA